MTSHSNTALVWFRQDLRLDDNPALRLALESGAEVIPVFIWAPDEEGKWPPGAASRWWLHQSLSSLDAALRSRGSRLILRHGPAAKALKDLVRETGASSVFWNRRYEPAARKRDDEIRRTVEAQSVRAAESNSALLFEPGQVKTAAGRPFQVFTPFWRACLAKPEPDEPKRSLRSVNAPDAWPESVPLAAFELEPKISWATAFPKSWTPGEQGGREQLRTFIKSVVTGYETTRDQPAINGTSQLSPHLHWGEISPRRVWNEIRTVQAQRASTGAPGWKTGPESYLREICWREFAYHLLYHFPATPETPLREKFARFPWRADRKSLAAWHKGGTGYPLVDAGMRQLWTTGWMHNRVRMVVASFLVKDLRINWLEGAEWFWDTLVDADLANNSLGWQWVAGCGADAAPYFRIFNPVTQGEKFDPAGQYVRSWVPEIAGLADQWIHKPWQAPPIELQLAGITLGKTYPKPIVDHAEARREALEAFQSIQDE